MKKRIIGLLGYAQSGKDTVAGTLVEKHDFHRVAFADALRDAAYALNPLVTCFLDGVNRLQQLVDKVGWDEAKQDLEVRRLLQVLGTEVGREIIDPDVWVNIARRKALNVIGFDNKNVVITDVRFPNETSMIRAMGGELWRVKRAGTEPVNAHTSETAVDHVDVDWHILNNRTLEDLAAGVSVLITLPTKLYGSDDFEIDASR